MTEFQDFIETKNNVTEQTKKNYRTQYKSIVSILGKSILEATEQEIINAIHQLAGGNYSSEFTYINLPIMIRVYNDLEVDLLLQRREDLKGLRDFHTATSKVSKQEALPEMKLIQDYIKELFKNKLYKKYIVNYLIANYGVRNKDANVFIVSSAKEAKDESQNYLIVKKNEVEWRINDYKTLATYGPKKIIIKAKAFMEAINALPLNTYLLTGTSTKLNETGLGTTIKRMLYNNLTEGDIFKIILNDINTKQNTTQYLQYYSKTRGTNLETIMSYYDVSKKININEDD